MTHTQLLKLYGLSGMLRGLRSIAKIRVRAAHDCMTEADYTPQMQFHRGSRSAHVCGLRDIRKVERALDAIIKETE